MILIVFVWELLHTETRQDATVWITVERLLMA